MLLMSSIYSQNIKIQLDERFNFVGVESYDTIFGGNIQKHQSEIDRLDTLIKNRDSSVDVNLLLKERSEADSKSLDFILKAHIQKLLLKYYDSNLVESRLTNMDENISKKQKYVYLKANVSKVNKVEFIVGGELDFSTKKTKEKKGANLKQIGVKETILTVTAGIEIYNLSTGELYYTNVYTFGSKIKRDLGKPLTEKEILDIYKKDLMALFAQLIDQTSKEYNPSIVEATIVKKLKKNTFIIDKGSEDGFITGKTVSGENKDNNFDIIESSPKVALIKLFSDNKSDFLNQKVKLFGNKVQDLNKPKVLVNEVDFIESYMFDENLIYDKGTITQWFKDYLSTYCNLFIVPSDPRAINNFQEEVSLHGATSSKTLLKKLIKPDYIIYPKIIYAYNVNAEGQIEAGIETWISTLEALLEIQLIDFNTGIILKTKRFKTFRDQEQSDISKVSMNELFPGLIKDGIITMCEQLAEELTVSKVEAEIQKGKKNMHEIKYNIGSDLKNGEILKAYRKNIKVENTEGDFIGYLEEYIGDVRVVEENGKIYVTAYMPWTEIKPKDIIRGYSSSAQISENLISMKMKLNETDNILYPRVFTKTKAENQKAIPANLVLSNYYYAASNNKSFTPILDNENQKFLEALKELLNRGYYARSKKNSSNDTSIKYYVDIKSTIYDKNNVHESRIDLKYASRIRLFDPNHLDEFLYKSTKGIERTIGDSKSSKRKDKKRAKKNVIMKGMSDKDINREFFDANLNTFNQAIDDLSKSIN